MPILSVVLTRNDLGLPPLELTSDPEASTYWLAEAPAEWPLRSVPRPRRWDHSVESLATPHRAELELPLAVWVTGASAVEVYAARQHLTQVLGQREYEAIVLRPGQESVYRAVATAPTWTSVPAASGAGRTMRAAVRIPLTHGVRPALAVNPA